MRELTLAEFDLIVGGDTTTVSPVIVTASSGGGWGDYGGGYGEGGGYDTNGGGDSGSFQQASLGGDLLDAIFGSYWFTPQSVMARNASTQYDENHHLASTWVTANLLGVPITYELKYMDDGSFYIDFDKNGTPESHFMEIDGEIFIDSNNDGSFDTSAGSAG